MTSRGGAPKAAQHLDQTLVISHLDYCSSIMAGLPASAIRPLQLIQNAAARLKTFWKCRLRDIMQLRSSTHMEDLGLPVQPSSVYPSGSDDCAIGSLIIDEDDREY
ncbi:unnamed protein product [Pleuronectes platessa]|uniref:Uncharacterized protein n=1 Tax=Pleuronectes platessa TaxID=8262 RepID=A0A9N7YVH2_PLEPL|nr:unnamed protein product [Pleuronectes platessa]